MVDVPRGIDRHGGWLPPPPPAGAGGWATPAPKMFEVPGTSSLIADPQSWMGSGSTLILIEGAVEGGTSWAAVPVQPAIKRHAIARVASR